MKRMRGPAKNERTLEEILDSDDELTTDFAEEIFVPAYQDNNRFKYFEELKRKANESLKDQQSIIPSQEKYIKKAIFSKKDVFCFQSVQTSSTDTLLWFFNFLIYKDLQSNYSFLKSCLVPQYKGYYYSKQECESNVHCKETQVRYKLVIRKQ